MYCMYMYVRSCAAESFGRVRVCMCVDGVGWCVAKFVCVVTLQPNQLFGIGRNEPNLFRVALSVHPFPEID
jgi:hypothetical protein